MNSIIKIFSIVGIFILFIQTSVAVNDTYIEIDQEIKQEYVASLNVKMDGLNAQKILIKDLNRIGEKVSSLQSSIRYNTETSVEEKIRKLTILAAIEEFVSGVQGEKIEYASDDSQILRAYFSAISDHEFQTAYDLKYNPEETYENFSNVYRTIEKGEVQLKNIEKYYNDTLGAEIYLKDEGVADVEKYESTFKIVNGKVQTISVNDMNDISIITSSLKEGEIEVYVEETGVNKKIYVVDNGKKDMFREITPENVLTAMNSDIILKDIYSDKATISYSIGGELSFYNYGDFRDFSQSIAEDSGFSSDGEYVYTCSETSIGSGTIKFYKYGTFYPIIETGISPEYCLGYDPDTNVYNYMDYDDDTVKSIVVAQ